MFTEAFLVLLHIWYYPVLIWLLARILWREKNFPARHVKAGAIVATVLVFAFFFHFHMQGYETTRDLQQLFVQTAEDYENGKAMYDLDKIIKERNNRLNALGLCIEGKWWVNKFTGEPADAGASSFYYWCGDASYDVPQQLTKKDVLLN